MFTNDVLPAIAVGLAAALAAATSNAMQHRVAGTVPASVDRPIALLTCLVRKPVWLLATTISFSGLLLHGAALRQGSIALVQPIILVGMVLAIPIRAALELKTPTWREVRAVLVTMIGLGPSWRAWTRRRRARASPSCQGSSWCSGASRQPLQWC